MAKLTKIFIAFFCLATITSCGKKSGLIYPGGLEKTQAKKFEKVIEGYDINDCNDKNFKYYFDRKQPKKIKSTQKPPREPLFNYSKTFTNSNNATPEVTNQNNGQ